MEFFTSGKVKTRVIIDDEDFPSVKKYKWLSHGTAKRPMIVRYVNRRKQTLSSFILGKKGRISFINGDSTDHRKSNLKIKSSKIENHGDFAIVKVQQKDDVFDVIVDSEDLIHFDKEWYINSHGYLLRKERMPDGKRKDIFFHRLITNCPDGMEVDHINSNRQDNRKSNLRICTKAENSRNRLKTSLLDYKGIGYIDKTGYYSASIKVNGKTYSFHGYKTQYEAAQVYDFVAKLLHKEFAHHNNLPDPPKDVQEKVLSKIKKLI